MMAQHQGYSIQSHHHRFLPVARFVENIYTLFHDISPVNTQVIEIYQHLIM